MSDELKPCPFCGSDKVYYLVPIGNPCIICPSCHSCFTPSRDNGTKEEVMSAWNTRHESDELPEWVKDQITLKIGSLEHILRTMEHATKTQIRRQMVVCEIEALKTVLSLRRGEE